MTFQEWAALQDTVKVYTATLTLKKISDGSLITLYFSTDGRVFDNNFYEPAIKGVPRFTRKMQEVIYGNSLPSWGDLELVNSEASLDVFLTDYAWDDRPVEIKVGGDPLDWADYQTILSGVLGRPKYDDQTVTVPVFDNQARLHKIVCSDLFDAATYPNMAASDLGKPIPVALGTLKNIRPYCTNTSSKLTYKVSRIALKDIPAVYDNDVSIAFTKDLANGSFTLSVAPSGTVTCDVLGVAPSGTLISLLGDMCSYLLTAHAGFSSGEIDAPVLGAFNTDCPYDMGYYITEQEEVGTIIDKLIQGCNTFYGFSRAGKFQIYQFKVPAGTPALTLGQDVEILSYENDPSSVEDIYWQVVLCHTKDWNKNDWKRVTASDAAVKNTYLSAKERGEIETFIVNQTDAQAAADHFLALWKISRGITYFSTKIQPLQNNLGDVISISRPRFGLNNTLGRVVDIEEDYTANQVKMGIWP